MITARLTALARLTFGNRASQIYLGLVVAAAVLVAVDTLFVHHEDASFAGVWLFFLAAPTVFLFFAGGGLLGDAIAGSSAYLYIGLVLSVLIQSAALGAFVRLLRGGGRPAHPREA
ncbi:SCO4225 family membrane protein [Streptomyces sp. NPDC088725]|uniref:SCO4225 family membrane protein n=1 Tax=Streptomyces sp. NPDC088725 TaxID=3365873 RepID=UPI00381F2B4D